MGRRAPQAPKGGKATGQGADGRAVRIRADCFVRAEPGAYGAALGVAKRGGALPYGGATAGNGWLSVVYGGMPAWVSGRFGRLSE